MRGAIRRARNRGERGVTMPLSLLLFLICSVAASIVITAATTASGVATNLKRDDRLYYSAASAAAVITDEICDSGSVTRLVFKKTGTGDAATYELYVKGSDEAEKKVDSTTNLSLLQWASICSLVGVDSTGSTYDLTNLAEVFTDDVGYVFPEDPSAIGAKADLKGLTVSLSGPAGTDLPSDLPEVTVDATASTDGSLTLEIVAAEGVPSHQTSTQTLFFVSAVSLGDLHRSVTADVTTLTQTVSVYWEPSVYGAGV